ncbi:MAG: hypothetical protein ACP5MB_10910, partial [bacterium]
GLIMSPFAVGSPIADWLATKGITGLPAQILNNIPVYGSWSALNTGLSGIAQGQVPTLGQEAESFGLGAALGVAVPTIGKLFGMAFPRVAGWFSPKIASTEIKTVVLVDPNSQPVSLEINPDVTGGVDAGQLMQGRSYNQITEKVYPNLLSRLLGRTTTYQFYTPLTEDLITAAKGLATTEDVSAPLYIRGSDGILRYVTDIKINPQLAISEFSKALDVNYNIANADQVASQTLPAIYDGLSELPKYDGIPFEGKIYSVDDFIKAIQRGNFASKNLPAIIGKNGEPLPSEDVLKLIFDLKDSPPADFVGRMWKGIVDGNPAIYSEGAIYSQPSLFERLLRIAQRNPRTTFEILQIYLKNIANSEGISDADNVVTDTALKLTNNMLALQNAINNALATQTYYMLPPGSGIPILTSGMSDLEARLFNDLVAQGFLDQNGNPIEQKSSSEAPTPSGGSQEGNEGYIYIQNPDGTISMQKVVQTPTEEQQQQEKEITKEEQKEIQQSEESEQTEQTQESEEQIEQPQGSIQITEPTTTEGSTVIEPTIVEGGSKTEVGGKSISGEATKSLEGQPIKTISGQKVKNKVIQGQPVRTISVQKTAQKTIPVTIQEEQTKQTNQNPNPTIVFPTNPSRKPLEPFWLVMPKPMGVKAYSYLISPSEEASIYSPSLLPLILPGIESIAERSYNPLTATTFYRPLLNPTNKPLVPGAEPIQPMDMTA